MRRSLFAFLILGVAPLASANLINDGGFENPVVSPGSYQNFTGGDVIGGAWTTVGTEVSIVSTTYGEPVNGIPDFNAEEGLAFLDLTGAGNNGTGSGVSQSFASTAGQSYLLSFWVGTGLSNNGSPYYQTPATDDLSVNGGARVSYTNLNMTSGAMNWEQFQVTVLATGSSTNLTFYCGETTNAVAGLDNVSVVVTPEPASFAVVGLGLFGLIRRRRH